MKFFLVMLFVVHQLSSDVFSFDACCRQEIKYEYLQQNCFVYVDGVKAATSLMSDFVTESDMSRTFIYYEPRSRLPLRITSFQNILSNSSIGFEESPEKPDVEVVLRRMSFRSNGCTCQEYTCGCCAGFNFQQFNFNREGCMNFTYEPYEFAIGMDMYMNGNSIFSNSVSAKNPPPVCIPVPIPYLPMVDFCAKLFDIHTPGQNLHMCLDFETRIQRATVLVLHFNCMRMGTEGVSLVKPGESFAGQPTTTETQENSDKFDEVTEIKL